MMCSVFLATSAASGHAHVNRSTLVFKLLPATSSNWSLVKPVRQWVPVTFLANPLLYSCAKLPLYPVSIRVDPELVPNEFWNIFNFFWARSERPRKKGLGGFSSDLKPDLFPPWKRLSYEWDFGVRKCLWSPKFPTVHPTWLLAAIPRSCMSGFVNSQDIHKFCAFNTLKSTSSTSPAALLSLSCGAGPWRIKRPLFLWQETKWDGPGSRA